MASTASGSSLDYYRVVFNTTDSKYFGTKVMMKNKILVSCGKVTVGTVGTV